MGAEPRKKVLAVASGGGHWVQLLRLRPSLDGHDTAFVSVDPSYERSVEGHRFFVVKDANKTQRLAVVWLALQMAWTVLRFRPDVVLTTGAAPGYFAIRFGKALGAKTIWLDSIANAARLSLAGQMAEKYADVWLTQWPAVSTPKGPHFRGKVL